MRRHGLRRPKRMRSAGSSCRSMRRRAARRASISSPAGARPPSPKPDATTRGSPCCRFSETTRRPRSSSTNSRPSRRRSPMPGSSAAVDFRQSAGTQDRRRECAEPRRSGDRRMGQGASRSDQQHATTTTLANLDDASTRSSASASRAAGHIRMADSCSMRTATSGAGRTGCPVRNPGCARTSVEA